SIEPKKRPLSSMSPTILMKKNEPFYCFASTGGRRIISTSVQIINNLIDHEYDIQKAISAPRFFHYTGNVINIEQEIPSKVQKTLENIGY
ncbi:MAG: gamma-glutamyltransferase, partial [Candidatus Thorarchaeota archaeon]|nr:gamma-glutamyltransferase [Candidatus Thorarchaeota archaeon]